MKIAIVHDWFVTNAGAEKVLKNIVDIYPKADISDTVGVLTEDGSTFIFIFIPSASNFSSTFITPAFVMLGSI